MRASTKPRVFERESVGEAVWRLQRALIPAGLSVTVNGVYDTKTVTAVKKYRSTNGLTAYETTESSVWALLQRGKPGVSAPEDLRARREAIVREHMESENHHDFDVDDRTFDHPRYEIIPTGEVFDGEEAVRAYFEDSRTAFPDQRNELIALHHTDAGVIVEFDLQGPTAARCAASPRPEGVHLPTVAFFLFEEDRIVCERVYFDAATILSQLGLVPPSPTIG